MQLNYSFTYIKWLYSQPYL